MSSMVGEFVTETFGYDSGRQVTVYVPPDPPEAVVFAGDGQLLSQWGGVLEAADVPSTLIVGVHRPPDETLRLHEYSPRFDPERFAAHERFFVEDVRRRVTDRLSSCRARFRARTSLRARANLSSTRTRLGGQAAPREAGADVVMTERVGSHGDPFWRQEFPLMVAWAFGP